jgi:5,10-methylenetetrahydromethanopterin reductase
MGWRWTDSPGVALMGPGAATHLTAWARAAESAGLGSLWIIEDYYQHGAFALAGAAAAATGRITIGLGVVNPFTRHPAVLAMETAALAGLAPGRIVLGLGTSNRNWIEAGMRIPFKAPLRTLREGVEIVRRLLAGERLDFHGERFELERVGLDFAPASRDVPVLLGVKGPRALGLAGEVADGVHGAVLTSPGHVRRIRATTAAARVRGAADPVVVAYVPVVIAGDRATARAAVRPLLARYLGVLHGQSILADAGLGPADTRPFRDALVRGASATDLVTEAMVDALAAAGTPADCREALGRLAAAGLDAPIAVVPPTVDMTGQLALIGAELVPFWRETKHARDDRARSTAGAAPGGHGRGGSTVR